MPEIFRLSVTLKQDLNLLFFLLTLTYYFFLKSSIYKKQNDTYLFLIFLSLSLSIKAWALPFIFLLFFDKFNYSNNIHKNNPGSSYSIIKGKGKGKNGDANYSEIIMNSYSSESDNILTLSESNDPALSG